MTKQLNTQQNKKTKRVLSGCRATGRLHLGNYLGAVKGYLELTSNPEYECIFMVVDLHAVTTPYDKDTLSRCSKEIIIDYLATGLDPEKAVITAQSLVPEHTYLAFLLSSVTNVARMQHLPTYKEKAAQYPDEVTMALLNYPVLMAADILAYQAELVPVGIDQEPHLEIAREIARRMNVRYKTSFPEPQRFATSGEYVPSIKGKGKMSKSVEGSYINLMDSLEEIRRKLKAAPTDSGKGEVHIVNESDEQPKTSVSSAFEYIDSSAQELSLGVANLMTFVELFEGKAKREYYQEQYQGAGVRYGDLKEELAQAIFQELEPIQQRRFELETKPELISEIMRQGAGQARTIAQETLTKTKSAMGFLEL